MIAPPHKQGSRELVDNNNNFMIVPRILVCSSFLISVCMFIVLNALVISSATLIVRAGRGHLIEPLCYRVVY